MYDTIFYLLVGFDMRKNLPLILILLVFSFNASAATFSKNTPYRVCFTPGQQCTTLVTNSINDSKYSIYVQAYSFTSPKIAKSLIDAHIRGIKIYVILDKSQIKAHHSQYHALVKSNIPVWIDNKVAIAHNKIMIFDNESVLTGSFNFTRSAQRRNAENIIIIQSSALAEKYHSNWVNRKNKSYKAHR
jgi:phosphatidylserine/phosphatidylglycerophosphate/cardiolipin synthase-like enzyme